MRASTAPETPTRNLSWMSGSPLDGVLFFLFEGVFEKVLRSQETILRVPFLQNFFLSTKLAPHPAAFPQFATAAVHLLISHQAALYPERAT